MLTCPRYQQRFSRNVTHPTAMAANRGGERLLNEPGMDKTAELKKSMKNKQIGGSVGNQWLVLVDGQDRRLNVICCLFNRSDIKKPNSYFFYSETFFGHDFIESVCFKISSTVDIFNLCIS